MPNLESSLLLRKILIPAVTMTMYIDSGWAGRAHHKMQLLRARFDNKGQRQQRRGVSKPPEGRPRHLLCATEDD